MATPPGTLEWVPARDRLDLLGDPVAAAVTALALDCYVAPIDPTLADTEAFCEAYAVDAAESANCIVVAGRRGEVTTYAACHVLATDKADVNKAIRKHLDVRKISFADTDTATSLTGQEYGGICAIGVPPEWPILIDAAVAAAEWVVIGSGLRSSKIALPGRVLAALPGAEVIDLAVPR